MISPNEIATVPHLDRGEKTITFCRVQDCEDIVERNKALQAMPQARNATWRHIGSIPNVIIEKWLIEEWNRGNVSLKWSSEEFDKIVECKLRDPDWRWLRTDK
jgi:hypothetical protein